MILTSEEKFIEMQQKEIPEIKGLIDKIDSGDLSATDYGTIGRYLAKVISLALIGELNYVNYLYYTNKLMSDGAKSSFFLEPRKKTEVRQFLHNNF